MSFTSVNHFLEDKNTLGTKDNKITFHSWNTFLSGSSSEAWFIKAQMPQAVKQSDFSEAIFYLVTRMHGKNPT